MQPTKLQTSLYERVRPSPATDFERQSVAVRSVLDCNGERVGELEGEFAVVPA
jgi:hypothetical protein